jgi:fructose-specific component phosphotransferase system IIB-like protein
MFEDDTSLFVEIQANLSFISAYLAHRLLACAAERILGA